MTTAADSLTALARAWLDGDADAGPPLHDALEEAGWPLEWLLWSLYVGDTCLAHVTPHGREIVPLHTGDCHFDWAVIRRGREGATGTTFSFPAAKAAAEAALRRNLRGE